MDPTLKLRKGQFGCVFKHWVTNFKPLFLSPLRSKLKNFSAHQKENFLRILKLTLLLFLVSYLRELWAFKTWEPFFWDTLYILLTPPMTADILRPTPLLFHDLCSRLLKSRVRKSVQVNRIHLSVPGVAASSAVTQGKLTVCPDPSWKFYLAKVESDDGVNFELDLASTQKSATLDASLVLGARMKFLLSFFEFSSESTVEGRLDFSFLDLISPFKIIFLEILFPLIFFMSRKGPLLSHLAG